MRAPEPANRWVLNLLQRPRTAWVALLGLLAALLLTWLAAEPMWLTVPAGRGASVPIVNVQMREDSGNWGSVTLPQLVQLPGAEREPVLQRVSFRFEHDLPEQAHAQALYASGLLAHMRLRVNGQLLVDDVGPNPQVQQLPPRPRGRSALRLVELPQSVLKPGRNQFELELVASRFVVLSGLHVGDRIELNRQRERKLMGLVTGPVVVATIIGSLGLAMLLVWTRRAVDAGVGYFGLAGVAWGVHTLWTVAPRTVFSGVHFAVWWTTLYAVLVVMLVLFALRFVQLRWPRVELALLLVLAAVAPALYLADAFGQLDAAAEALRLALVLLAFAALAAVARHAWYRRSMASALFVAAGVASAGLGLRDWLVFHGGEDLYPVPLTPYAGLPFILLVSWLLIERFVRTAESFEAMNRDLEGRVAQREAELADNYQRMSALERQQAANDERARILRELHDGVGAKLLASLTRVEQEQLSHDAVARELRACLTDMRLASETLTPGQADLAASVGNLLFRWQALFKEAGVKADWRVELPDEGLPMAPHTVLQLLRVMQEAFTNVLRHARARQVRLELVAHGGQLQLTLDDDGIGMAAHMRGRGLHDMSTRASAIGARFALGTPAGGGVRVLLVLPLAR